MNASSPVYYLSVFFTLLCRYAQFYAFISVIELPRIPAYRPKIHSLTPSRKVITFYKLLFAIFSRFSLLS